MRMSIFEKFWPLCWGGGGRNYDCWLGRPAKFLLSENSDKTPLTELAKNQAFPLFMAACGWRRPGFFTPSVTFENRASRSPDVFLACSQKTPFDVSTSRHIVRPSYGYGALWAHALCPTYLLYTNIFPQYSSNLTWRHMHKTILGAYVTPPTHFSGPSSSVPTPEINSFFHGVGFSFRILTKPNQVISNPIPSTFNTTMWGKKVLPK